MLRGPYLCQRGKNQTGVIFSCYKIFLSLCLTEGNLQRVTLVVPRAYETVVTRRRMTSGACVRRPLCRSRPLEACTGFERGGRTYCLLNIGQLVVRVLCPPWPQFEHKCDWPYGAVLDFARSHRSFLINGENFRA